MLACPYCEKEVTLGKTIAYAGHVFHKSCWKVYKSRGFVKTPGHFGAGKTVGPL